MYYRDLTKTTLENHKQNLKSRHLIPSWQILLDDIDTKFEVIKNAGIEHLDQLKDALKTKNKAIKFAETHALSESYVIVLRREVLSHHPPPRKLSDYPTLEPTLVSSLSNEKIKTSVDIYPFLKTHERRKDLAKKIKFPLKNIENLAHLIDVTRLRYVSPLFATLLVEAGYDTIPKIANATINEIKENIMKVNEEKVIYKGKFGENDIKFLIEDAQLDHAITEF